MPNQSDLAAYTWWLSVRRRGALKSYTKLFSEQMVGFFYKLKKCSKPTVDQSDILLIHPSEKSRAQNRKSVLINKLKRSSIKLTEITAFNRGRHSSDEFCPPDHSVPLHFYLKAGHAKFLIEKYNPSVIITERYDEVFSFYLRYYGSKRGAKIVHLAHSIPSDDSDKFSLNNFDYYFLFGKSSIDKLKRKSIKFGSSKAVAVGSYLSNTPAQHKAAKNMHSVLILAMGSGWSKFNQQVDRMYAEILNWVSENPDIEFSVKLHPASTTGFWEKHEGSLGNLSVHPIDYPMNKAVQSSAVVVNMHSNACIDAAALGRPILYFNLLPVGDEFEQSRFFLNSPSSSTELNESYRAIIDNYTHYVERSREFSLYHMRNIGHGSESIAEALLSLAAGNSNIEHEIIKNSFHSDSIN